MVFAKTPETKELLQSNWDKFEKNMKLSSKDVSRKNQALSSLILMNRIPLKFLSDPVQPSPDTPSPTTAFSSKAGIDPWSN